MRIIYYAYQLITYLFFVFTTSHDFISIGKLRTKFDSLTIFIKSKGNNMSLRQNYLIFLAKLHFIFISCIFTLYLEPFQVNCL